jgi:hypothetical protein
MRSSRSVRQTAFCVCRTAHFHRPLRAQITDLQFRQTGKPGSRKRQPRRSLHAGKRSEWSALEKPVALLHRPPPARKLFASLLCSVELVLGAGEGNRTPDPLITNQMLYRLSYASNWGQARLRANLSHGSLPDVRDNYIKYHTAKLGRNNGFEGESWASCLADAADVAP